MRSGGDEAGVFEYDGDSGYFYLYETGRDQGQKIIGALRIATGTAAFEEGDIAVRWNLDETMVGLFIRGLLWAAFDAKTGARYGGDYRANATPEMPAEITSAFEAQ